MRVLANENVPAALVERLRSVGHDVARVRERSPGIADPQVIEWAINDQRVLLTFDKDFGELAFAVTLTAAV